jgi:hypothetical protein
MKKITAIGALALVLASCTTETVIREVPATDPAPQTTQPTYTADDQFIDHVYYNAIGEIYLTNAELIELGLLVCEALDAGNSIDEVAATLELAASTDEDIALFAAIAVGAIWFYCPQYEQALNNYLNTI